MGRGAVPGDAVATSAGGGRPVAVATEQQLQKTQLRSSHELQKAHAHAVSASAGPTPSILPAAVGRTTPSITAIGVDIGPDGSFQKVRCLARTLTKALGLTLTTDTEP